MGAIKVGKVRSFANGNLYIGPDWCMLVASTSLLTVPSIIALAVVAFNLWTLLLTLGLYLSTVAFLFITAFSDPGIIPPQDPPPTWKPNDDPGTMDEAVEIVTARGGVPYTSKVVRKWCYTCHVLRPPRASHCAYCDCCIERHDHHCPWTGTCIGGRNYRFFYLFVLCCTFLGSWVFAMSVTAIAIHANRAGDEDPSLSGGEKFHKGMAEDYYLSTALVLFCMFGVSCVGSLCTYHTRLICDNQTTHERIRGQVGAGGTYDEGCPRNTATVLCGPRSKSRVPRWLRGEPPMEELCDRELRERRAATDAKQHEADPGAPQATAAGAPAATDDGREVGDGQFSEKREKRAPTEEAGDRASTPVAVDVGGETDDPVELQQRRGVDGMERTAMLHPPRTPVSAVDATDAAS